MLTGEVVIAGQSSDVMRGEGEMRSRCSEVMRGLTPSECELPTLQ